jgi:uncharacterized protein
MNDLAFVLAGLLVGLVVGLTGVGGGSLMTPILIFFFGFKPSVAVGTDLLFAAFTKLGGSAHLAFKRQIEWRIVARLSLGSIPASLFTIYVLSLFDHNAAGLQGIITTGLGIALVLTAAATFYKAQFGGKRPSSPDGDSKRVEFSEADLHRHPWLTTAFGAVVGVLITLTSVGAGAIGVTALMLLYPTLPLQRLVATDIAYAVPITLVAGLGHAGLGTVNWPMLGLLLCGSLPGIWLGSRLGSHAPERWVRSLLSLLIAYAGIKLIAL